MFEIGNIKEKLSSSKALIIGCGALVLGAVAPFLIPDAAYQSIIERNLSKNTGLHAQINGPFDFSLLPSVRIEAQDITFNGTIGGDVDVSGQVALLLYDMDVVEFLSGQIFINEFVVQSPQFSINGDFIPTLPNWVRENLAINTKSNVRYQEMLFRLIERTVFRYVEVTEGNLTWNKSDQETIRVDKMRLSMEKPASGRDFLMEGDAYVNDRSVDMDLSLERPDNFLRGYRSALIFHLDSSPFTLSFEGSAAHRRNFIAQGDVKARIPSLYEYCRWLSASQTCHPSAKGVELTSNIRFRDQQLQIEQADFHKEDYHISATGVIDFKPVLPMITADIETPVQELSDLLDGAQRLGGYDFNTLLVDTYDARINLSPKSIQIGAGETIEPTLKAVVKDGRVSLNIDDLDLFGGNSNLRFRWNKGLDDGYMDLRFDTTGVDLARLQRAFGQNFEMDGSLKTSFEVQSLGSSYRSLLETARIYGEYSVLDGVFYNLDVAQSLGGLQSSQFEFAEMKGRINGDRGEVRSNDIRLVAPRVLINGAGTYDFLNNQLKVQLRSETQTARTQDQTDPTAKGFVEISGSLNRLGLITSANTDQTDQFPPFDGLHSGLLPITDDDQLQETQEDYFINETDLLD